ncbi:MAG: HAD family hydrolase, partial [Candidatus Magasanikbacteria bacterium]
MSISTVGFDWDGTLVKTMQAKATAFALACIYFHQELEEVQKDVERRYLETRGASRFYQLREAEKLLDLEHVENEEAWSEKFSELAAERTQKAPLQPGAREVLEELEQRGLEMFVSSSVPHEDLQERVGRFDLHPRFEHVLGQIDDEGFHKGVPHIDHICEEGVSPKEIAFVGDGDSDMKAAEESNCGLAIAFNDPQLPDQEFEGADEVISDLHRTPEIVS